MRYRQNVVVMTEPCVLRNGDAVVQGAPQKLDNAASK